MKMKFERGDDAAHAFLELLLAGVQESVDTARHAVYTDADAELSDAMEWAARDAGVIGALMRKVGEVWITEEAAKEVVELDREERMELLRLLRLGTGSLLEKAFRHAGERHYCVAANEIQELGEALRSAAKVFRGMEEGGGE